MKRILTGTILLIGTTSANACAVCFQNNHARTAYLATTAALILLPATLVGSIAFVIRRRMKALERETSEASILSASPKGAA